uniref:Secreted protein n=1 Tax=Mesocestoides corti TaxID=53468 RepID=A0A5K3EZ51_MESCO
HLFCDTPQRTACCLPLRIGFFTPNSPNFVCQLGPETTIRDAHSSANRSGRRLRWDPLSWSGTNYHHPVVSPCKPAPPYICAIHPLMPLRKGGKKHRQEQRQLSNTRLITMLLRPIRATCYAHSNS